MFGLAGPSGAGAAAELSAGPGAAAAVGRRKVESVGAGS